MCVRESVCMCTMLMQESIAIKKGHWSPWNWSYKWCVSPCVCREWNPGLRKEQNHS